MKRCYKMSNKYGGNVDGFVEEVIICAEDMGELLEQLEEVLGVNIESTTPPEEYFTADKAVGMVQRIREEERVDVTNLHEKVKANAGRPLRHQSISRDEYDMLVALAFPTSATEG